MQLLKSEIDGFGENILPIPPSCLVSIYAEVSSDTVRVLKYSVALAGVDSKIIITRSLNIQHPKESIGKTIVVKISVIM